MATYDYRCRTCDRTFEVRRSMSAASSQVCCPEGHEDVSRVWSAVSLAGRTSPGPAAPAPAASGCCGGGCCA